MEDPQQRPLLLPSAGVGIIAGTVVASLGARRFVAGVDVFALGAAVPLLLARWPRAAWTRDDAVLLPRRDVVVLAVTTLLALATGRSGPRWTALAPALASGIALGLLLAALLVAIGAPKTRRLTAAAALLAAAALGAESATLDGASLEIGCVLLGLVAVAARPGSALRAPKPPVSESFLRGLPGTLGVLLVGSGAGALLRGAPEAVGVAAGAVLLALARPSARRAGGLFGVLSAFAFALDRRLAAAPPPWLPAGAAGGSGIVVGLLAGAAAVCLPRFYVRIEPGKKVLGHLPFEERRTPEGGLLRAGALLLGLALSADVARAGGTLACGACVFAGAWLAVLADARAGAVRRLWAVLLVAGAAALGWG